MSTNVQTGVQTGVDQLTDEQLDHVALVLSDPITQNILDHGGSCRVLFPDDMPGVVRQIEVADAGLGAPKGDAQ